MSRLDSIPHQGLRAAIGTCSVSAHVLAINAASAATVKTTGAIVFRINGITRSKAALAAQSIAVTHNYLGLAGVKYVQPASKTVYYALGVNAAGTVAVVQGGYDGQTFDVDAAVGVGPMSNAGAPLVASGDVPGLPDGYAPFGLIKVVTDESTTFTPGTTALDAEGLTVSFYDVGVLPADRP